ncbi:MAG: hypothetical protein FJ299_00575 [Planctomycetes bacterium]|nr:hypothetical protein [Planctomycetota bacterium]
MHRRLAAMIVACALLAGGCSAWKQRQQFDGWTLWTRDEAPIDGAAFERALEPAFAAIEREMGPFEKSVAVHAWSGGVELESGVRGRVVDGEEPLLEVPGMGPARVRAFHSRGDGSPFSRGGIYLGEAEASAAAHELVHARLAELELTPPLWFEEGLASLYSDGALVDGAWVIDGFAFWPWKELRAQRLSDAELGDLLALDGGRDHSLRENLLVHFLGWALVFDIARAAPEAGWRAWLETALENCGPEVLARDRTAAVAQARAALERTLDPTTPLSWLKRLDSPDPGVRLAAARGTWKLATPEIGDRLLAAIAKETDREVRTALVVNLLIGPGQTRYGWQNWWRMRREAIPHLREPGLDDPLETEAAARLYSAWRGRGGKDAQEALRALRRLWEE